MKGGWWIQAAAFCGHKWFHCYGAIGIFGPDGICYEWYDEAVGRHSDKYFMRKSGINAILANLCTLAFVGLYHIFTDAGFANDTHIIRAFIGFFILTAAQRQSNQTMARVRIAAEWGFGRIRAVCPLITREELLRLREHKVSLLMRNAVLLTNYRNMIGENNTALYFNCRPPSLEEYFG
jgi:hypothetical protein